MSGALGLRNHLDSLAILITKTYGVHEPNNVLVLDVPNPHLICGTCDKEIRECGNTTFQGLRYARRVLPFQRVPVLYWASSLVVLPAPQSPAVCRRVSGSNAQPKEECSMAITHFVTSVTSIRAPSFTSRRYRSDTTTVGKVPAARP